MLLIIIRPKNKNPAFPAKAGEKPMVLQLFQQCSEKGTSSNFSSISSQSGHPALAGGFVFLALGFLNSLHDSGHFTYQHFQ